MIEENVEKLKKERPRPIKSVHNGAIQYTSKPMKGEDFTAIIGNLLGEAGEMHERKE